MKQILVLCCGISILMNLYQQKNTIELRRNLKRSNKRKAELSILLSETTERALNYQQIAYKLDSIANQFQSSRNAKRIDEELLNLNLKVN